MSVHPLAVLALVLAVPASASPSLRELGRSRDQSAIPALREALAAGSPEERAEAAWGLGQLGLAEVPDGAPEPTESRLARAAAADLLAPAVADPDPSVRAAAATALAQVGGRDSESFLLAAATDFDARVRAAAALALFRQRFLKRVDSYSAAAVDRLIQLAADPDPEVRWRAAYAFTRWSEPRAAEALKALSFDSDARARLFAARALGKQGLVPDAARLSDADVYVRAEAVAAFSSAKAWDRLPDAVFVDTSAHVRAAAAAAAGASGDAKRFVPLLETLAAEPGTLAPGAAVLALGKLGDAAAVGRAAADPRGWLRARAAEASAALPDAQARLLKAAADPDARVQEAALEGLAGSTAPAVLALFDRVLRDPKSELEARGAVADADGDMGEPSLLGGLEAAKAFARGPGSAELREGLLKAFRTTASKHPETAGRVAAATRRFKEFDDKPRRFRPLKKPVSVTMTTERGTFVIRLSTQAGVTAAAFAASVKKGFYDGLTWHRVVTAFVVQGGDPRGSGWGDAGWRLADENGPEPFLRGTVGMPRAGPDTGGCQLFVSLVPTPHLDGRYTVFGQVVSGLDVLDRLEPGDKILSARLE